MVLQTRPRAAQIVSRISGGLMIIIALFLSTEQILTEQLLMEQLLTGN
ncbi:hypothetical protein HKX68_19130 [Dickeya dadantii]|nr:hypothetical protein [Dickeya dadantii]NPE64877.1 hypothetical protein [Dickeya dadantii]